jgi:glycosyltransferase involved in cell wall biosynthesis
MSNADRIVTSRASTPRVSVITPAYNAARYIREALDSVFAQTFQDVEVIVVNDGSPDTPQLEAMLQPYLGRFLYVKQQNRGVSAARNLAIQHSRGELLAFLDADDVWLPQYLDVQLNFLDKHPGAVAAIADVLRFGECAKQPYERRMLPGHGGPVLTFEEMLQRKGGQLPSATVVRRSAAIAAGLFDEELRMAEDVEFFVRLCHPNGSIGYPGRVLVKYRQRPGSLTEDPRRWVVAEIESLKRLGERLELNDTQRKLLQEEISSATAALALSDAYHHVSKNEVAEAARCFRAANSYYRDLRVSLAATLLEVVPRLAGPLMNWRLKRRLLR